jgi:penicillin-binding protein 2
VEDVVSKETKQIAPEQVGQLTAKQENLAIIRKALVGVNIEGTSAAAFRGAGYSSGGKTGTAQVITIAQNAKYNASQMDERHRDHALYMAYAPAEDPKIAIAMVVENVGFGAANAAPIVRRAFDYYLLGQYPSEEDIALVRQGKATTPVGKPRPASEYAWPPTNMPAGPAATAAAPGASISPAAAVVQAQTVAAAFSPLGTATTGTPTAGTSFVPRWREPAPAAATAPQARSSAARATPPAR